MPKKPLRIIPLGGLGEVGKNMMALEYGKDIIVVDAGVLFPEEDMPGIDLVIPDISYLVRNRNRVRAIFITHGHEDHTGALPYVLRELDVPVYAPRLAYGLISVKLKEHRALRGVKLHEIEPDKAIKTGSFSVEFFRVCHSIPDAMGLAIRTPLGLIIHTGDFKIDHTPVDGMPTDLAHLAGLCKDGVLLLLSDSTYAEVPGYTASERVVGEALDQVIGQAQGRVIVATFASLIARIQQIMDAASRHHRKVAVVGRSMVNNVKMALEMGYLSDPGEVLVPTNTLRKLQPHQTVVVTTGSQGEPTSALVRIANGDHRDVKIRRGDTVVISATPIPGNETVVSKTIDNLLRQGAEVLHDRIATVHVHGHASQEELKTMLNITRPRFFIPVHGAYHHLVAHGELARLMGVEPDNIFILEDGDVLELAEDHGEVAERVPAGHVYVDGGQVWTVNSDVLSDRRALAREGVVVITLAVDAATGRVLSAPRIVSTGFMDLEDMPDLLERATQVARTAVDGNGTSQDMDTVTNAVRESVSRFLYTETHLHPRIIAVPIEV